LIATTPARAQTRAAEGDTQPLYTITVNVVDRTTKAINYRSGNGSTKIDFDGTALMPEARGEAKVEPKQGYVEVEVEFDDLQSATRFGPEFLTYVLWAITPEGRATNMGEIILNGTKSKLNVTSELQTFGMIVTAEPYFAVSQPSDAVVMENVVRGDTVGQTQTIEAKYQLLERGQYTVNVLPADLKPIPLDENTPLDIHEARNAVRIAKWAGADVSAAETFERATTLLKQAEGYLVSNRRSGFIGTLSREAVQVAEDSRLITLKNQADARVAAERAASADRLATANATAVDARANAEETERERVAAAERAERDRVAAAERARAAADLAARRTERDRQAVETANREASAAAAEQSEREQQVLRNRLAGQLNSVLETEDSARGLIVNMSDVLFDTGQYSLSAGARETLSKISGIVLAYPALQLEVEGHTDGVGSDELNIELSENRARSVRDYLIAQGIVSTSIASRGYGESRPVATNDTSTGRQQNRRVELVVSGEVIGSSSAPASGPEPVR
jgi:outer membrane protein OmpA-like peptidoglycan-associated protein